MILKQDADNDCDEPTATCFLCREKGIVTKKYESWQLYEHLNSKEHPKSSLASFVAYEAVYQGFWKE